MNVWLALADEDHVHHARARRYWEEESATQIAFCRLTMLGLLRLATNSKVMAGRPFSPPDAWRLFRDFLSEPGVAMAAEPAGLDRQMMVWSDRDDFSVSSWTDCALASWACAAGFRLVSFDSDYSRFAGLDFVHLVD
ncbi:MAG TPA: TA system VapC family ribonuclease toxin [Fimbriimonadaceae bacterium]|nr:TA system VapC family ribonuclease toxin [Fimbriimonadaceae bacterium]